MFILRLRKMVVISLASVEKVIKPGKCSFMNTGNELSGLLLLVFSKEKGASSLFGAFLRDIERVKLVDIWILLIRHECLCSDKRQINKNFLHLMISLQFHRPSTSIHLQCQKKHKIQVESKLSATKKKIRTHRHSAF